VGVLALQGASGPHREAFARLGHATREVRSPADLAGLTHLVLPGGESTTLARLLGLFGLDGEIACRARSGELALFGTCAGAILMATVEGGKPATLGLLDARIERNGYGRQVDSFRRALELAPEFGADGNACEGVFIRAPRFVSVGPLARVLARSAGEPVALEAPGLLATTFHPELTGDTRFHRRFLGAG
jgi:5'-phosphate synthase pdxT subunit